MCSTTLLHTVVVNCNLQSGLDTDSPTTVVLLLQPHLSDGLAAVRVDPEGSRLDHFLWIYLGDGPLHLIYQSPAGCVEQRGHTHEDFSVDMCAEHRVRQDIYIPPHLMSCPCLAAWQKLRRRHRTTHDVSSRAASLILHLQVTTQISPHHGLTHQPANTKTFKWLTTEFNLRATASYNYLSVRLPRTKENIQTQNTHYVNFSFNLQVSGSVPRDHLYAFPRCSIAFGEMWWRSSGVGGQDGVAL